MMKKRYLFIAGILVILVFLVIFLNPFKIIRGTTGHARSNNVSASTVSPATLAEIGEPPVVDIPVEKQQLMGVKTMVVEPKQVQKSVRTIGRIEYDEKRVTTVNTKFEGWIEKLYVDYTGRYVEKGEPIAEIYSPELYATQMEFINLLKWTNNSQVKGNIEQMLARDAEAVIDAAKHRLRLWDIRDEQIEAIKKSGKPLKTVTIYSPVSGFVIQKPVIQGMRVMPGERLLDIVDLSSVWVVADIYEYELPLIDVGQPAEISLSYIPDKIFKAKIEFVYPSMSGDTRTAKVRFSLPNKDGLLKPKMFTEVTIKRNLGRRLIIPHDAVIDTGTRQIVYVDKGDGYFEPRQILPGLRADGSVEVIKGLKAGERIAVSGNFLIDSEARLKGVLK